MSITGPPVRHASDSVEWMQARILVREAIVHQLRLWDTERALEKLFNTEFDQMGDDIRNLASCTEDGVSEYGVPVEDIDKLLEDWLAQGEGGPV